MVPIKSQTHTQSQAQMQMFRLNECEIITNGRKFLHQLQTNSTAIGQFTNKKHLYPFQANMEQAVQRDSELYENGSTS